MFCSDMIDEATVLMQAARSEAPAEDWARPLLERQLWILGRLAEDGLQISRAIARQATGAGADDGLPAQDLAKGDVPLAYARVARAVRMTLLLQSKLIRELQFREASLARDAARAEADQSEDRKARVERIVGRIALAEHDDVETVEQLVEEAAERLDQDDIYGDVLSKPVSEIVARVCQDLGLDPDWPRLAEEAWAREEIQSGAAGSPLAGLRPDLICEDRPPRTAGDRVLGVLGGPKPYGASAIGSGFRLSSG